jgi:hypothetical protein
VQAADTGDGGQVIVEGAPVSTGWKARVTEAGDYRFFAGWRSDPFIFDRRGAVNNLQFTGDWGYRPDATMLSKKVDIRLINHSGLLHRFA